ncbi:MAG TPA: 3'-5' exonuclease [Marinobacter sp.]|uniref:Exonuclease domain-containing protein n=1 Tax=marine sediment metagenome TaxID=412755 RepID=A0A0F9K9H5_9ZZZZ|nr:3'-5' exonuclease [Marinobacter sp.]
MNQNQFYAVRQARAWLELQPVYLDTETTSFSSSGQIINLALIDSDGQALINTLIRPTIPIPEKATAIHGIRNDDIVDAPAFSEVLINLAMLTENRIIIVYNAAFDWRMLRQSAGAHQLKSSHIKTDMVCAMRLYTQFFGEKTTLTKAAQQLGLDLPTTLHRAAADAALCREVVMAMAATPLPGEEGQ